MIGGRALHAVGRSLDASEDVAAADDDADLDLHVVYVADFLGDPIDRRLIEAIALIAHQRLTGQFQKDTAKHGG